MVKMFRKDKKDIIYKLSTFAGQSGAPLLLIGKDGSFKIIGVHKGGVKLPDEQLFNASRHITPELLEELKEETKKLGAIPFWKSEERSKNKSY